MIRNISVFICLVACFLNTKSYAQPTLPEVGAISQGGINILSWVNPYTSGVKGMIIQRSRDSVVNFVTIGNMPPGDNPVGTYVDAHPNPGANYYLVKLVFSSGMEWKSNIVMLHVDSADLSNQKVLPPNDSLQKLIAQMGSSPSLDRLNALSYTRSIYVYTNPYNGNINIELPDVFKYKYHLTFFDDQDKEALDIPRINDPHIILDKRNFQRSGLYRFKLYKNNDLMEEGHVTVY